MYESYIANFPTDILQSNKEDMDLYKIISKWIKVIFQNEDLFLK